MLFKLLVGKKIWKSGNPTAGVKKKRRAFSHILGSEGFPKLREASYKSPNYSPVQMH